MRLSFLIFISCLLKIFKFSTGNSVTIKCCYFLTYFAHHYYCEILNKEIFTGDRVTIEKAEEQHLEEKSYDDFDAFEIVFAPNLKFLPKNINNIFKNLAQIEITHSSFTEITSEDLKVFPKLKVFDLNLNQIKIIREDTFKFNPNLKKISLMYNKINHIDPKSFGDLKSLEKLGLKENICEFGYAFNRNEVLEVIKKIKQGFCL